MLCHSDHASVPPGRLHPDEDDHVAQEGEEGARDAREALKLQAGHSLMENSIIEMSRMAILNLDHSWACL